MSLSDAVKGYIFFSFTISFATFFFFFGGIMWGLDVIVGATFFLMVCVAVAVVGVGLFVMIKGLDSDDP